MMRESEDVDGEFIAIQITKRPLSNFKSVDELPEELHHTGEVYYEHDRATRKQAILNDIRKILKYADKEFVKPKEVYRLLHSKYSKYYQGSGADKSRTDEEKARNSYQAAIRCFVQERCFVVGGRHKSPGNNPQGWAGQPSRRREKVKSLESCWILSLGQSRLGWRFISTEEKRNTVLKNKSINNILNELTKKSN